MADRTGHYASSSKEMSASRALVGLMSASTPQPGRAYFVANNMIEVYSTMPVTKHMMVIKTPNNILKIKKLSCIVRVHSFSHD